jgi:alkylhydroperoxidase family enzyme
VVRFILLRVVAAAEASLGESLDYLRFMLRASVSAFFKFVKLTSVSRYRRALPLGPFHVVRIAAARHEDCGPCVQTTVNMAKKDGIPPAVLRALVDGRPDDLPEELADTYRFVDKVLRATYDEGELREKIRARYGTRGNAALTEIALVLSSARAFPVTKRVLGYATSCKAVAIDAG